MVMEVSQLSVAVGITQLTVLLQLPALLLTVMLAGQPLKAGRVVSVTVTVKLHVSVLPALSVATKVTIVVPTGNTDPDCKPAVIMVVVPEQLSVPTGVL